MNIDEKENLKKQMYKEIEDSINRFEYLVNSSLKTINDKFNGPEYEEFKYFFELLKKLNDHNKKLIKKITINSESEER